MELLQAAHYSPPTKSLTHAIPSIKTAGRDKKKMAKKKAPLSVQEKRTESKNPSRHLHPLQEFEGSSRAIVGSPLSEPGTPNLAAVGKSVDAMAPTASSLPPISTLANLRRTPYAESAQVRSVLQHYNQQLHEALKAAILTCLQQLYYRLITAHEGDQSIHLSVVNVSGEAAGGKGVEVKQAAICFTLGIQFFIPRVAIHPSLSNLCSAVEKCTALVVGTSNAVDSWDFPSDVPTVPTVYTVLRRDVDIKGMQHKILEALRGEPCQEKGIQPFKYECLVVLSCGKGRVYSGTGVHIFSMCILYVQLHTVFVIHMID